jgi:hypothetical protein
VAGSLAADTPLCRVTDTLTQLAAERRPLGDWFFRRHIACDGPLGPETADVDSNDPVEPAPVARAVTGVTRNKDRTHPSMGNDWY